MNYTASAKGRSRKAVDELQKIMQFMANQSFSHPLIGYACKELGLSQEQLYPKPTSEIEEKNASKEVNELRFQHIESRRKAKILLVAEFLMDNKLISSSRPKEKSKKLMLTPSSIKTPAKNSDSPSISFTQELQTERRISRLKKQFIFRLAVEENQKRIKQEEEESRKAIQEKIKEKEKREKSNTKNTKIFEVRDQRIKERLEKKQKDLEQHELQALKQVQKSHIEIKPHWHSFTPPHRYVEVIHRQSADESINEKLEIINFKLNESVERAKKQVTDKAMNGQIVSYQVKKVQSHREEMDSKKEEELVQKVMKIHQDFDFSNVKTKQRRRAEKLKEQKKMNKSAASAMHKKFSQEREWQDKMEKESEIKDIQIEKVRKEIKEMYEHRSNMLGMKIALRKKDQEDNLRRIQLQMKKDKVKLIEKIKDSDCIVKVKTDMNLEQIKAEAEKEFKAGLFKK